MNDDLKPCPFCGKPAVIEAVRGSEHWLAHCSDRLCGSILANSEARAAMRWNTRAAISAVEVATPPVTGEAGELVERLRKSPGNITVGDIWKAAAMLERYAAALRSARNKLEACGREEDGDWRTG